MTGAQIERNRAKERSRRHTRLGKREYEEFKNMLQNIDLSRNKIKRTMGFAYDNIECGEEIVSMIKEKLILPSSFAAVKIAGLYLLSDLLHNSATPIKYATNFKNYIEAVIPDVFESIAQTFRNTTGRMSAFNVSVNISVFLFWHSL